MSSPFDRLWDVPGLDFAPLQTAEGRRWIADLRALADELCSRWNLSPTREPVTHGYRSVVLPVVRRQEQSVLKLAWKVDSVSLEAAALDSWNGRGTVLLRESDAALGGLLLERLEAGRTLGSVPVWEAADVAGRLIREMAVPAPPGVPTTQDMCQALRRDLESRRSLTTMVPESWIDVAVGLLDRLPAESDSALVHGDLHFDNVLAGERLGWAAIDPKPLAADPERAAAELMWTRVDELTDANEIVGVLRAVVAAGDPDFDKAARWTFVRTIDHWLWAIEHGLTADPARCHRVAGALLGHADS